MTNAACGPTTRPSTSPSSSTSPSTCSEPAKPKTPCACAAKSPPGTKSPSPPTSPHDPFSRFPCVASRCPAHIQEHGVIPSLFRAPPLRWRVDVADDRLPALADVDVLDGQTRRRSAGAALASPRQAEERRPRLGTTSPCSPNEPRARCRAEEIVATRSYFCYDSGHRARL